MKRYMFRKKGKFCVFQSNLLSVLPDFSKDASVIPSAFSYLTATSNDLHLINETTCNKIFNKTCVIESEIKKPGITNCLKQYNHEKIHNCYMCSRPGSVWIFAGICKRP